MRAWLARLLAMNLAWLDREPIDPTDLELGRWLTDPLGNGEVHVVPIGDLIEHADQGCLCGPRSEAVFRDDGSNGWLVTPPQPRRQRGEGVTRASEATGNIIHFYCPGCDDAHGIRYGGGGWSWNESLDLPTFSPSVLVGGVQWDTASGFHKPNHNVAPGQPVVCHSFVTDGRIQFLGDCTHALAGQTVDLPDWPYGDGTP